jgi:hypothetical protein
MKHLIGSLERNEDIGHYGRMVFVMVARHFMSRDEMIAQLSKDRDCSEADAADLIDQIDVHDYNPPTRQRILEWMDRQGFPICPDAEDPGACNVYRDLTFPDEVYRRISGYYDQKARSHAK